MKSEAEILLMGHFSFISRELLLAEQTSDLPIITYSTKEAYFIY